MVGPVKTERGGPGHVAASAERATWPTRRLLLRRQSPRGGNPAPLGGVGGLLVRGSMPLPGEVAVPRMFARTAFPGGGPAVRGRLPEHGVTSHVPWALVIISPRHWVGSPQDG